MKQKFLINGKQVNGIVPQDLIETPLLKKPIDYILNNNIDISPYKVIKESDWSYSIQLPSFGRHLDFRFDDTLSPDFGDLSYILKIYEDYKAAENYF